MKKKKAIEGIVEKIIGISFFVIGILLLVSGLLVTYFSLQYKTTSQKITGIVVGTVYGTEVKYTVQGQEYEAVLSERSSNIHVGDNIDLYVDKEDPYRVRTAELLYLPSIILGVIGLPFLIIGIVFIIIGYRGRRKKKQLLQTGRKIYAEVTGGRLVQNYTVNGRHPYKLECTYTDIATGAVYMFSSGNIWLDPHIYIGQQISVYVDPGDYKKHYVDVDSLHNTVEVYDYR